MKNKKWYIRYIIWGIVFLISIILTTIEYDSKKPKPEKQDITAYVSSEFKSENSDIESNITHSDLGETYSLEVSNVKKEEAQFIITTDFDEISSSNYEVLGKTPLIVVLKQDKDMINQYIKNGLLKSSDEIQMDKNDKVEIDFKKLIDAVLENKNWSEFGGENKEIKIFYPELTTVEGKLFKHFLLITANGGSYPTQEKDMETSQKYVEEFLEQSNVQAVNVLNRLTGVDDFGTDIYVTFENNVMQLDDDEYGEKVYIGYPTETVEKQAFFESTSEIGDKIKEILAEGSGFWGFYSSIIELICKNHRYRYEGKNNISEYRKSSIYGMHDHVNFKDAYNCIDIPEEFLKTSTEITQ